MATLPVIIGTVGHPLARGKCQWGAKVRAGPACQVRNGCSASDLGRLFHWQVLSTAFRKLIRSNGNLALGCFLAAGTGSGRLFQAPFRLLARSLLGGV